MILEILCNEPIYTFYSGVLETCLALRYWFFEVLGSESVKAHLYTCNVVLNSIMMYNHVICKNTKPVLFCTGFNICTFSSIVVIQQY